MRSYRSNYKNAIGHIQTSDSILLERKDGDGIGDIFSSVSNFLSNHGSKLISSADALGKTASAAKNILDAKKSYSEMSKAGEELDFIKKKRRERDAKKRLAEEQQIASQSNKAIQEIVRKAIEKEQPVSLRQGNGLKKL